MSYYNTFYSPYTEKKNKYMDEFVNREKFNYNADTDALYNTYRRQYESAGRQAAKNAMGDATALSGGYANSYAQQVSQQTFNQYMNEIDNMLPEFEQRAFERYQQEGNDLLNYYQMYNDAEANDYNKWSNERSFEYNKERDAVADAQWYEQFNYNKERDAVADSQWEKQYNASLAGSGVTDVDFYNAAQAYIKNGNTGLGDFFAKNNFTEAEEDLIMEYVVNTNPNVNPRNGKVNMDTNYGTFDYTWQPDNVSRRPLTVVKGKTANINGQTQKVWSDGNTEYVWDGVKNKYITYEEYEEKYA